MNMYYYNMVKITKKVKFEKLLKHKIVANDCVYIHINAQNIHMNSAFFYMKLKIQNYF